MAADVGRNLILKRGGVAIGAARSKTMSFGDEPIDITTDDELGWRALLEAGGQRQLDMSVDGLLKNTAELMPEIIGGTLIDTFEITLPDGSTVTGSARLNSVELGAEYQDAISFSAELQSTGVYTFTP